MFVLMKAYVFNMGVEKLFPFESNLQWSCKELQHLVLWCLRRIWEQTDGLNTPG